MAVLDSARSSARQIYQGSPSATTATTTGYTTPAQSQYVTSPSATFYIKEIIIVNYSGGNVNASVYAGGTANANLIEYASFTSGSDTKWVSSVNTYIPAGQTIYVQTSVASSCTFTISGVEVQ